MTRPYYDKDGITLYLGDCRRILPELGGLESMITDPVWPDAEGLIPGSDDPYGLFRQMCEAIPQDTMRLVVELACDSDPRFLSGIPTRWPFLRVCWLDYAHPSYKGRLLYTGDVAYAYGIPPKSIPGRQLMSGMCRSSVADKGTQRHSHKPGSGGGRWTARAEIDNLPHPTPRRSYHVRWLVRQFSDEAVCDPFLGSGTTGVAAKQLGRRFVGIEIVERYLEYAAQRIEKTQCGFTPEMDLDFVSVARGSSTFGGVALHGE